MTCKEKLRKIKDAADCFMPDYVDAAYLMRHREKIIALINTVQNLTYDLPERKPE